KRPRRWPVSSRSTVPGTRVRPRTTTDRDGTPHGPEERVRVPSLPGEGGRGAVQGGDDAHLAVLGGQQTGLFDDLTVQCGGYFGQQVCAHGGLHRTHRERGGDGDTVGVLQGFVTYGVVLDKVVGQADGVRFLARDTAGGVEHVGS